MSFKNFMVDLETTGTDPAHTAIIQIAAVAFDLETLEVGPNHFDECLAIPTTRYWEEGTRDFWMEHQPVLNKIWARMRDPGTVLREFASWIHTMADGEEAILWAKPTHFEQPFLQNYFRTYDVANPFHYRKTEDLNSWCRARGLPNLSHEIDVPGDAHDAIFDVLHQLQVLFTLMERTNVTVT